MLNCHFSLLLSELPALEASLWCLLAWSLGIALFICKCPALSLVSWDMCFVRVALRLFRPFSRPLRLLELELPSFQAALLLYLSPQTPCCTCSFNMRFVRKSRPRCLLGLITYHPCFHRSSKPRHISSMHSVLCAGSNEYFPWARGLGFLV